MILNNKIMMFVTWNIDCDLYTIEQLEKLAQVVYEMDISVGNHLYDAIKEKYLKEPNPINQCT